MKNRLSKAISLLLLLAALTATVGTTVISASFGSGVAVLAEGSEIIKSGLKSKKMIFSDLDFKQGLSIPDFEKITVTKIPPSSEGTLLLAGRRVGEGTVIKRKNIGALVFIPASPEVSETGFSFTTEDFADGAEVRFTIKLLDSVNYSPKVEKKTDTTSLTTQRDIPLYGKMEATDNDSETLTYLVISYPKHGYLKVTNDKTGEFCYTPPTEYVGETEFTYVARDEFGNFSKPATLVISVTERLSEVVYTDMTESKSYNAAVALTALGVMDGRLIGDGVYFMPDSTLTREEFVSMAMKSAGIKPDKRLTETFFDDGDTVSAALIPYIATAQNMGIITGNFKDGKLLFSPKESITKYEAALVMASILDADLSVSTEGEPDTTVPVYARAAVGAMYSLGIFDPDTTTPIGTSAITKAEAAEYLYRLSVEKSGK